MTTVPLCPESLVPSVEIANNRAIQLSAAGDSSHNALPYRLAREATLYVCAMCVYLLSALLTSVLKFLK